MLEAVQDIISHQQASALFVGDHPTLEMAMPSETYIWMS